MSVLSLTQSLIRCPSVTPDEAGALDVVEKALRDLGFTIHRQTFSGDGGAPTENLYARIGDAQPNLCFAGHVDVVPAGRTEKWSVDPFSATVQDGVLIGRGAVDMKAAIAAMIEATGQYLEANSGKPPKGSISFLITCDEEGDATNGTKKMLAWLAEKGEKLDACVVGEPTSDKQLGDVVKVGRRGSINTHVVAHGHQGHVAYPELADNPIPKLLDFLHAIEHHKMDAGSEFFPPSNLEITTIDVGNPTSNLIPAQAEARFNIRFNPAHSSQELMEWLLAEAKKVSDDIALDFKVSGEAFLSEPGHLAQVLQAAVKEVCGAAPALTTTGGTSDARFIQAYCPVAEFGALNATAHKIDEQIPVADIESLEKIYYETLIRFF